MSIVFIQVGNEVPQYAQVAVDQARFFNPGTPVYFIGDHGAPKNVEYVDATTIKIGEEHRKFRELSSLDRESHKGFWYYASERFLYLNDFIQERGLRDVFHVENDVMLYADLGKMLDEFRKHGVASTFDNDERGIAALMYVRDGMEKVAKNFANFSPRTYNDMHLLGILRRERFIGMLPVVSREYVEKEEMVSRKGHRAVDKFAYCQGEFGSLFDAAAFGQFLGGDDPKIGHKAGWVNEQALYDPSKFKMEWGQDSEGRKVPYVSYGGTRYRLNNLHIHCKDLNQFKSY